MLEVEEYGEGRKEIKTAGSSGR